VVGVLAQSDVPRHFGRAPLSGVVMPRVLPFVASIAFLASVAPLHAQQSAPTVEIRTGSRVRLDAPGYVGDRMVATVISRTDDTLTVASQSAPSIAVPVARITRLEVSRGDSRTAGALHGIKIGVPIGAVFGVLGLLLIDDCNSCSSPPNRAAIVPAFAASGAFYGAIIGALVQREQWAPFALTPRVSFDAGASRAALALHVRF
jgi:hypothetical protein